MRDETRESAFDLCLQQVLQGASIDEVLRRYPQWAVEFRPMLEAAAAGLAVGRGIQVPQAAQRRSRARLLSETRALSIKPERRFSWSFTRLAPVAFVLLLAVFLTGATTIAAAAQSLPGDTLYSLKLITEKTRLRMVRNPQMRLDLERSFDRQRLEEVDELISQSRTAPVMFAGELEQISSGNWVVGDVRLIVDSQTQISSDVRPGIYVGVQGVLQEDGSVKAERIWGREFELSGIVQEIVGETWVVGGVPINIPAQIALANLAPVGSLVTVRVMQMADGSLVARSLELGALPSAADQVTVSPPASASATVTSTEDTARSEPTGEDSMSGEDSQTPERKETDDEAETEEPTKTRRPSETSKPDDDDESPEPSKTSEPDDDDDDDDDKSSEVTKTPEPRDTDRPRNTPEPDDTEEPTKTPKPEDTDEHDQTPEPTDD